MQRQEDGGLDGLDRGTEPAAFLPLHPPGQHAAQLTLQSLAASRQGLRAARNTMPAEIKLGSSGLPGLRVQMKLSCRKTKLLLGRLPWRPATCTWGLAWGLALSRHVAPLVLRRLKGTCLYTNTKHGSGDPPEVIKFYPEQRAEPEPEEDGKSPELLSAREPWLSLTGRASVSCLSPSRRAGPDEMM